MIELLKTKNNEKNNLANETDSCISSSMPNKHTIDSEEQDAKRLPSDVVTPSDNKSEAHLLTLPSIQQNNTTSSISLNSSTSASEDEVRFWSLVLKIATTKRNSDIDQFERGSSGNCQMLR